MNGPAINGLDNRPAEEGGVRSYFGALLDRLRRGRRSRATDSNLRNTLEELIEEHDDAEDMLNSHEWVLVRNIFKLRTRAVDDIMVPRADIAAIEESAELSQIVRIMSDRGHSRIPVYRRDLDDVVGMVHIKDVLASDVQEKRFLLSRILRPVLFVAPSMRVLDLLQQMRETRVHIALIVDEFGGIDGLATIEDLVEEIVGEIVDEHDVEPPSLFEEPDGSLVGFARAEISEFESRFGPLLTAAEREEDIDTLGGLVFSLAGRVPSRGEVVHHSSGVEFEVLDANPRSIRRLRVRRAAPVGTEPGA